jgi:hypothetical protein
VQECPGLNARAYRTTFRGDTVIRRAQPSNFSEAIVDARVEHLFHPRVQRKGILLSASCSSQ